MKKISVQNVRAAMLVDLAIERHAKVEFNVTNANVAVEYSLSRAGFTFC